MHRGQTVRSVQGARRGGRLHRADQSEAEPVRYPRPATWQVYQCLTTRALPKTLTDNGVTTGPQFDSAEISRLGRNNNADSKASIEVAGRARESNARLVAGPSTPASSSKSSASFRSPSKLVAPLADLPRQSRLPDAMKRYVPPPKPVVESPHSSVLHTTFVEDIEASLESWARERGMPSEESVRASSLRSRSSAVTVSFSPFTVDRPP